MNSLLDREGDPVDITISVGYSEDDEEIELIFTYGGEPYNPLEAGDRDELSIKLVTNLAKGNGHSFQEGKTHLRLTL